ncbi:MAG: pyruvate carboxylase [Akkermansiaceae bacterium]|jgi:pyruvate carboxylase|nr:pyruvate carboxylase [Akkermansiaceae bacterium]MDP4647744.1 pyruvate carboxylase [Akkermansiaceae bacterium]MDP4780236.1 pyruvate carboxylase [Akkermansiaceae bacterium]MDP4848605.1 pyruvate carboxylase [Akkermansiaceae bacterium]MDP4898450.1 pyruvate carboxylase [Akkermansiaceae bacterium]
MPSNPKQTGKLLAANRGEIAIRIFRAATELGLRTVSIFAEEDRFSIHRFKADEAYQLDSSKGPVGAYLDYEGIVKLAKSKGVTMIHPGYGFLSENPHFARACAREGITFIGPSSELLENMGDKTAARALAHKFDVPTLPGTEDPITDPDEALTVAHEIGFPLIIKAAFGGGGRGMRVVEKPSQLPGLLAEARAEAENAFGNSAVFLERYIKRAKHIEVQILGDQHGNVVHLYERDCSVQRRYQKVVEVAPAMHLDPVVRKELCDAAVKLAAGIGYNNAGTVEFLYDMDQNDWFFIEMNPRIQVEHTVTECVTGIDLVRSQILVAAGKELHGEEIAIPSQDKIPCNGFAIQCRITTEDPEKNFAPDYGRILNYRSAAGFGIRLDAASGDAGSVVTPFYDSMLVKLTAMGSSFPMACQRMDRALREFRIRGVKTNIPFLENVIADETFRTGQAHTKLIDTHTDLFKFSRRRDRATRTLAYLTEITVNGNPHAKAYRPPEILTRATVPEARSNNSASPSSRALLRQLGPENFSQWILDEKRLLITDTTMRDAHQSLIATRMRTHDMLRIAETYATRTPEMFSLEMWGGATFDTSMRFLNECPWERLRRLREKVPDILFQMLFRGSNAVGYSNYPDNVVAGFINHAADSGMDIFRIFDSLNYLPNMQVAMEAVRENGKSLCEAAICYSGDILNPSRTKYDLNYYISKAKEVEKMGAHILCIKDMAGLCKPQAAYDLVHALKQEIGIPVHFHTHDTSGLNAASVLAASRAGVDIADLAIASMSGSTSQPNLNSVSAALSRTERDTGLDFDALNDISDYWEHVLTFYKPFDSAPRSGTAEVYEHEMPGGQYTNLREQANSMGLGHRWREIARTYADVNQLFGDIIKVTPSSKVVGDMCMFLVTRGIKASEVTKIKPGSIDFPESVLDMLSGGLGQPDGGWPADVQKVVLGPNRKITTKRPGELAEPVDLNEVAKSLNLQSPISNTQSQDALYSHLMYPQVYADFQASRKQYDDLSKLPSPAFFYGLQIGEEIEVEIDPGKILIIKLISIGEPDKNGERTLFYELNGMPRESIVTDKSLTGTLTSTRRKGDPNDPSQICAPLPGMVTEVAVSPGTEVKAGDKLVILEAMKMLTTVSAPEDGTIKEIIATKGTQVDSDDLLVIMEP